MHSRNDIIDRLREFGINPTHQRIEIAYALFSRQEHLSADQILSVVNTKHSETSKATVYNTLNLFVERKLIREVIVDPSKVFYDPNTHVHHHFFNVATGQLTDIHSDELKLSGLPQMPDGMAIESIDVIVRIQPQHLNS
ncbi:MAG: transcriptional repressor [Sulfuricella sp.]|nr:transcriptional repressor [Sulfuricella sp.]